MLGKRLGTAGRHTLQAVAGDSGGHIAKPLRPAWADPTKLAGMSPLLPKLVAFDLDGEHVHARIGLRR